MMNILVMKFKIFLKFITLTQILLQQINSYNSKNTQMQQHQPNPFVKIKQNPEPTQAQTECPRCHLTGTTIILMVDIPLFREVLLCSFNCQHCGQTNNDVQFAGRLPDLGVEILFRCLHRDDLDRQIIRSQFSTIWLEQLQLQIPSKKAQITNTQALLRRTYEDLSLNQQQRAKNSPEQYQKICVFLQKVKSYLQGKQYPLTIRIHDPSGNSNIKNPFAPRIDKSMEISYFRRNLDQLQKMGYSIQNAQEQLKQQKEREEQIVGHKLNFVKPFQQEQLLRHEPVGFQINCEVCFLPGKMNTCRTSIPYFSDLVIMSFSCEYCGHHTTQTKTSGQIGEQCLMITLSVQNDSDLKRDLFKSESCFVAIPQLELQLDYGTLGGIYTTVQGLIEKIHSHLSAHNPFLDSDEQFGQRMNKFLKQLQMMGNGQIKFTLQLIDPLARSFLHNPFHPHDDPSARRQLRERTFQQNEMLGLNDMKV